MTVYPNSIDTSIELPIVQDLNTPVEATIVNRLRDAIVAIESELGIKPSSIYGTVANRVNILQSSIEIIQGSTILGGDLSGTLPNPNVVKINGAPVTNVTNLSENNILTWSGSSWDGAFITNNNIDDNAAIDGSKIDPNFGSQSLSAGDGYFSSLFVSGFTENYYVKVGPDNSLSASETINIDDLFITSQTEGDIIYNDGSQWNRLPAGTDADILTMADGVPAWVAPPVEFDPASPGAIGETTPSTVQTTELRVQRPDDATEYVAVRSINEPDIEENVIGTSGDLLLNYNNAEGQLWLKHTGVVTTTGWRRMAFASEIPDLTSALILGQPGVDVTVAGNFFVQGTTTTINSTEVEVADKLIHLNHSTDANVPEPSGYSGISVHRGAVDGYARPDAAFVWDEANSVFKTVSLPHDDQLVSALGIEASGLRLSGLTASNYVKTDANKNLVSQSGIPLSDLAGTTTGSTDGYVLTVGTPGGAPTWATTFTAGGDLVGSLTSQQIVGLTGVSGVVSFGTSITTPTIQQASTSNNTGKDLRVQAQNATVTGGALVLASGTGTSLSYAGKISFAAGATEIAYFKRQGSNPLSALRFVGNNSHGIVPETATASTAGSTFFLVAQSGGPSVSPFNGGDLALYSGEANGATGSLHGRVRVSLGETGSQRIFEAAHLESSPDRRIASFFKVTGVSSLDMPANSGDLVMYVADAASVPSANPVGGSILYSEGGKLKTRSSGGTVQDLTSPTVNANNIQVSGQTAGDLLYASNSATWSRIPAGTNTYVLTMVDGAPAWAAGSSQWTHANAAPYDANHVGVWHLDSSDGLSFPSALPGGVALTGGSNEVEAVETNLFKRTASGSYTGNNVYRNVEAYNAFNIGTGSAMTVEAYVNVTLQGSGSWDAYHTVLKVEGVNQFVHFRIKNGGAVAAWFCHYNGGGWDSQFAFGSSAGQFAVDVPHHVMIVWTPNASVVYYLDGFQIGSTGNYTARTAAFTNAFVTLTRGISVGNFRVSNIARDASYARSMTRAMRRL